MRQLFKDLVSAINCGRAHFHLLRYKAARRKHMNTPF